MKRGKRWQFVKAEGAPLSKGERGEVRRQVNSRSRPRQSAREKAEREAALRRERAARRRG